MLTTRIAVIAVVALWSHATGIAKEKGEPRQSGQPLASSTLSFPTQAEATEYADALLLLTAKHPAHRRISTHVEDNGTLTIQAPAHLLRSIAALSGEAGETPGPRRGKAERRQPRGRERERAERRERDPGLEMAVFDLSHANAKSLLKLVNLLHVGNPHPWAADYDHRTNTIIVRGTPDTVEMAEELIAWLDRPSAETKPEPIVVTKLMPLSHAEARSLAEVVSRVFRRTFRDLEVVPDLWTNTLVLAGPKQQVAEAASLIRNLDASPGAAKAKPGPKPAPKAKEKKKPKPDGAPAKGQEHKRKPKADRPADPKAKGGQAGPKDDKANAKPAKQQKKAEKKQKHDKHDKPGKPAEATPATDA